MDQESEKEKNIKKQTPNIRSITWKPFFWDILWEGSGQPTVLRWLLRFLEHSKSSVSEQEKNVFLPILSVLSGDCIFTPECICDLTPESGWKHIMNGQRNVLSRHTVSSASDYDPTRQLQLPAQTASTVCLLEPTNSWIFQFHATMFRNFCVFENMFKPTFTCFYHPSALRSKWSNRYEVANAPVFAFFFFRSVRSQRYRLVASSRLVREPP